MIAVSEACWIFIWYQPGMLRPGYFSLPRTALLAANRL